MNKKLLLIVIFAGYFAPTMGQGVNRVLQQEDATISESLAGASLPSRAGAKGSFTYMPVETIKEGFDIPALNFEPIGNPIVLGDINGDGFSDFAVSATAADERTADFSDYCSKSIIYYGNAAATLKYSVVYYALYPAGDMNKDGVDDVIAQYYDGSKKLLYGGVDGFTESTAFIPKSVGSIIGGVYDFDKDGNPDLLYRKGSYCGILLGDSDPAKIVDVDFPYGYTSSFLNVEGKTVVLTIRPDGLYLVSFNSDRTISKVNVSSVKYPTYSKFYNQDIDGDGSADFFRISDGKLFIYHNLTLASKPDLTTSTEVNLPSGVTLVPMGDINKDGRVEFVNTKASPYDVFRYNNGGVEKIGEADSPFVSVYFPLNNVRFDFNRDGAEDYLLLGSDSGFSGNRMLLGNTENKFYIAKFQFDIKQFRRDNGGRIVSLGDINGDGKVEVGIVNPYGVTIYHSDNLSAAIGDIAYKEEGLQVSNAVSGDINNDGFSDLILSYCDYKDFSKNILRVYLGGKDGLALTKTLNVKDLLGLTLSENDNMAELSCSLIGSVDGDALPEFAMSFSSQCKLYIFKGDKDFLSIAPKVFDASSNFGDTNFPDNSSFISNYIGSRGASNMGDLNGDGINDFMIDYWSKNFAEKTNNGALYVFYGNADLNFTKPDLILYDNQPDHEFSLFGFSTAVGDFNGDGVKDIATVPNTFNKTDGTAYAGLQIYYGGPAMDNIPDKTFYLPFPNYTTGVDENVRGFSGLLQAVPDLNGDSADELLIFKNRNYLFMGGAYMEQDSLPAAVFSSESGVTFSLPTSALSCRFNAAFGDFQHKGVPELIIFQRDYNYKAGTIQRYLVTNPYNKAPEGIEASSLEIAENKPEGTVVGTLTAVDVDKVDFHNFALTQNDSHADNSLFKIEGDKLIAIPSFDFEVKSSYTIMVKATDASGRSVEKDLVVSVTNVNEAPTNLALSATEVAENAVAGTVIGTLSAQDIDAGDALTYTFASGNGQNDLGNSSFEIDGNVLKTKQPFDFEKQNSYSIFVKATDKEGLSVEKELVVSVTNVNEAPANLALSATEVAENAVAGTVVGTLSAQDIDAGDALTYAFASGNGQNDLGNSSFEIDGNVLKTKQPFDFEKQNSYSIFVKATDNGGLSIAKEFVVTVTNVVETGIEDGVLNAISVYPNPASERVFVALPVSVNSISVVFTDLSGRIVYQGRFSRMQKVECPLSGVTGTILVKVVADGKVYTSKVVAQ